LLIAGLIWGVFNFMSFKRLAEVDGKIVGYEIGEKRKRLPIVEFQGSGGKTVRFTNDPSRMIGGTTLHVGKPNVEMLSTNDEMTVVKVMYSPNNPDRAHIKNFRNLLLGPVILLMIGIVFALAQIPAVAGILENL
jgi:hypothetical protein